MLRRIRPSTGLTVTPSTIAASEFGGRQDEYQMEYVTLTATYPEGYYENPNFSISGRIPIETDFSSGITYNGYEFKFEKSMETVTTGSNTLTLTITAKEWAN